ncbi:hypothetical protein [Umezawaea sp. Da 62-37]|uniref:hypothetical protein n=1 Tax=Umezawaea sp. Da 62-37 TaxID=3075927 RepID=UPI0028F726CA|nr:hypothetical protein [Umezawaea sp. Da 62-37]WNV83127.1 hypothetical protein RM788_33740 [Umezawaea sp. Da 62-37]
MEAAPDHRVEVELFFAGLDRDAAMQTAPFGSRGLAEQFAAPDDRIFSVEIEIDPAMAQALA